MAKSIADQLMERRATLINQAQEVAQKGVTEGRDLSVEEQTSFDQMIAEAGKLHERAKAIHEGEERAHELENSFRSVTGHEPKDGERQMSAFGKWAREARVGDAFDLAPEPGAERRAIASRGANAGAETRAMSASGGVAQDSVYSQLWEYAVAGSQILQAGVDVFNTTDGNTLPLPVATVHATTGTSNAALPVAISANGAITANDATLTTVNLSVSKYGYLTLVPTELVQDTTFDLEGYIARAAGRELSRTIGYIAATAAIAGFTTAGVTGPTGTATSLGNQATAGQGSDLIYQLFHSVLPEYRTNSAWVMGDPAAALIRQLKSTTSGAGVWQPALTAGDPDLLVGKPVYISPQIATMAANAKSIYFGEWAALKVRIAGGIRFERSNEYAFGNDQVAFRALVRTGAVTVDPNAVKYFANSAT
jgi:HK97 family phage major capsid protein